MKSLNVQKLQCWHVKGLKENLNSVAAARIEAFTWNSQALATVYNFMCRFVSEFVGLYKLFIHIYAL